MCAKNQGLDLQLVGIKLPSAAEVQPSSSGDGVAYDEVVLALHDVLIIWVTSGESPVVGRCTINLLLTD